MALKTANLVAQGLAGDAFVFLVPSRPVFPLVTTAPACHNENPQLVSKIKEMIVLQFAFQPNRVEVEITHVVEFCLLPFWRGSQQHVQAVTRAPDEDVLAIDLKEPMA